MSRTVALQSDRLSDLKVRRNALEQKITIEKKRLRDQSRVRAAIRARVIGECVARLREQGRLSDSVLHDIKEDLLAHVEGKGAEFESLQGTPFDLTNLLHDTSQPVTSDPQANG